MASFSPMRRVMEDQYRLRLVLPLAGGIDRFRVGELHGRKVGSLHSREYEISPNEKGILIHDLPAGALVQATYHGGSAADAASLISSYPDL